MKTSKHLDWLSITIPSSANWRQFLPFVDLVLDGKGRHGYGQVWIDKQTQARIETASTRDEMGTHLTLSGDVLNAMREDLGMIDDALIGRIKEYDGKCSRVDLAIDVYGAVFTPEKLNAEFLAGSARIPARTWRYIDGHKNGINGASIDTGSTVSDKRFRFYDKAAEQGIKDGEAWVRLELQLRRLYARTTLDACAQHGSSRVISTAIGTYLQWSNTDYQTAIACDGLTLPPMPRKDTRRKAWLLGQVASALASECRLDPFFRERFNKAVNYFMEVTDKIDSQNK